MRIGCTGSYPGKEDGVQALEFLAPSSQTFGSMLRILWPFAGQKNRLMVYQQYTILQFFFTAKMKFADFTIQRLSPNSFEQRIIPRDRSFDVF